jgi:hypothetical protein
MTINHKPVTPLPWNKRTNVSSNPDLPARMQDEKYRLHAANAYPKLIEEMRALVAWYAAFQNGIKPGTATMASLVSRQSTLLRELGEE